MVSQFLVVSYDITDDRRRRKVMKTVEGYGKRVQYSVFECRLNVPEIQKMVSSLRRLIKGEDSIRFYFIGAEDVLRTKILGCGEVTPERQFYLT